MMIEVQNLSRQYGEIEALRNVNLSVEGGGVVGLLGPNGAGKTTLVETLEGLRRPTSGMVKVLGLDPTGQARELRERLGVQLQSTALPEELTPLETLRMFGAFFRKSLPPGEVLASVGLSDQGNQRTSVLSGGQQQRLAIAAALINDPELVILDEPTAGLDPVARRDIHTRLGELRASKRTVLLSTHYIEEAEQLCDRVIFLRAGEVVADGKPFDLVAKAGGASQVWVSVEGPFDPAPILSAGAEERGKEGDYYRFSTPDSNAVVLAMEEMLRHTGAKLVDLRIKRPNLEDVYLDLVGPTSYAGEERKP
jgi:ABC-2 type transport system ATP-binding protein